jgi:hypothetical protein
MGKGKGKISYFIYKLPKLHNLLRIKIGLKSKRLIADRISIIKLYLQTLNGLKKIINKYPKLEIKK